MKSLDHPLGSLFNHCFIFTDNLFLDEIYNFLFRCHNTPLFSKCRVGVGDAISMLIAATLYRILTPCPTCRKAVMFLTFMLYATTTNALRSSGRGSRTLLGRCMKPVVSPETSRIRASSESRTRNLDLGKIALYQLSYACRVEQTGYDPVKALCRSAMIPISSLPQVPVTLSGLTSLCDWLAKVSTFKSLMVRHIPN